MEGGTIYGEGEHGVRSRGKEDAMMSLVLDISSLQHCGLLVRGSPEGSWTCQSELQNANRAGEHRFGSDRPVDVVNNESQASI